MDTRTDAHGASIDLQWSVNELLRRQPACASVLNAYGVDTCCGGALSVEEAALVANVPPRELQAALELGARRASGEGAA